MTIETAVRRWAEDLRADLEDRRQKPVPPGAEAVNNWMTAEQIENRLDALLDLLPKGDGARHLLTGVTETGEQVLIHVWANGTGELATRPDSQARWGIPVPLEPAP